MGNESSIPPPKSSHARKRPPPPQPWCSYKQHLPCVKHDQFTGPWYRRFIAQYSNAATSTTKWKRAHIQYLQVVVTEGNVALSPICIIVDGFYHIVLNVKCHLQHSNLGKKSLIIQFCSLNTLSNSIYSVILTENMWLKSFYNWHLAKRQIAPSS